MKETKIQWHSAFVSAMNLDLGPDRDDLIFEKEYNLNTKPLEIDLLVIKKAGFVQIASEIGKLFKGHNIMEYKSPEDHLDIDAFYKAGAYASLYKSYGKRSDEIKAGDVTVTIIREAKPEKLLRYFKQHGYSVSNPYRGIYYIEDHVLFPTQIVVTKELDFGEHVWLGALSGKLGKREMQEVLENIQQLSGKEERELADSVLEVSTSVNRHIVEEMIGDDSMCNTLMEIMAPHIELIVKEKEEEGLKKGLEQGSGIPVITHEIMESGIRNEYYKARRVAVTEILTAHRAAQQEAFMQSPAVKEKKWKHTGSYRNQARQNHIDMNGKKVPKQEPYTLLGADGKTYYPMYPGDPCLPAKERIHCHCLSQSVVDETILGLSLEERQELQKKAVQEMDEKWKKEENQKEKVQIAA